MKTKSIFFALTALLFACGIFAQDRTTVTAASNDISDNLDLRAVASIFGDSKDLEDFERRLNDPRAQISNLDLNGDRAVDYLRVIESVEGNAHLVIVQAVIDRDVFQDVATIQVERDRNNVVQVQVVGDVYMYGDNYIYEPVYVTRPIIYDHFWVAGYRPYWSAWYWNYYPAYYYAWSPYPIYRYRSHIHNHINVYNTYTYVNASPRYYSVAPRYRANGYAVRNPGRSFRERNSGVRNSFELQGVRNNGTASNLTTTPRNYTGTRNNVQAVDNPRTGGTRTQPGTRETGTRTQPVSASAAINSPRTTTSASSAYDAPRTNTQSEPAPRSGATQSNVQDYGSPRAAAPRTASIAHDAPAGTRTESTSPRVTTTTEAPRSTAPRASSTASQPAQSSPRYEAPRAEPRRTQSASPRMSAPQSSPRSASASPSYSGGTRGAGRR
jgi:hypothetical protein